MRHSAKLCTAVAAACLASTAALAEVPESEDPIKVIVNNWTSQLVLANVSGLLMQKMGYTVEYKPSDTQLGQRGGTAASG